MCDILCTCASHREVTQLCAECQGSCRQARGSAGFLASGPSPVPTTKMQSPSSKVSESLRSCASLPCSDERLVYLQAPSVPGRPCAGRGLGVELGTGMALRLRAEGCYPLLLLASLPSQTCFLDPSTPFQGIATIPTYSYILSLPRVPCFWSSRSAELGSRSNRELCDFREDALSLRPLKSERTFSTRWGFDP